MKLERQIEDLQALRASEWFEILKMGRPEDLSAFQDWCRRSPLHIQEFLEITWTDRALADLDVEHQEDLEKLLREISPDVVPWPNAKAMESLEPRRRLWPWAAAAAVATCALSIVFYANSRPVVEEFSTRIGEQRTVELADRSVVTMNTDSEIEVKFAAGERNIELRRGEAIFRVAHDTNRPFEVHTRVGTVRAVGTVFNVYDRPDGTDVAVVEGRVRLTARGTERSGSSTPDELAAGEEALIRPDGSIQRAEPANVAGATAWSKRRLRFDNAPLDEVVREFNRYHQDVRLRLEGVSADSYHYSGVFDADDPAALARLLERENDLAVEHRKGEIVIRPRQEAGPAQNLKRAPSLK